MQDSVSIFFLLLLNFLLFKKNDGASERGHRIVPVEQWTVSGVFCFYFFSISYNLFYILFLQ